MKRTSLSVGGVIYDVLNRDPDVKGRVTKVFPVVTDNAELPYVAYRRSSLEQNPVKAGFPGADIVRVEVNCYTADYASGVELAEAVRAALDHKAYMSEDGDVVMRSCNLAGAEEFYEGDAFVQGLTFDIRI